MVENGCVLDRQCALRLSRYVSVYVIWLTLSWCDWIMVWIISNPLETTWSNSTHSFCPISTDFLLKMKDIHQKINQIQVIYFMHDPNIEQIIGKLIQSSWNSIIVTKARNPNCIHFCLMDSTNQSHWKEPLEQIVISQNHPWEQGPDEEQSLPLCCSPSPFCHQLAVSQHRWACKYTWQLVL